MKRNTGSNGARMMLWAVLAMTASLEVVQRIPAMAQNVTSAFEIPAELPQDAEITISSDHSMAVISESLKRQFASQFADAKVEVDTKDSDAALESLIAGQTDMAAMGRPLSDAEKSNNLNSVLLDREKIAIFVAEENPFKGEIGFGQFARIFRGEMADWSELGGQSGAIRVIDRPDSSDTRKSLSFYPVFQEAPFVSGATTQAVKEDNTALIVKNLGTDGIGYAPYSQLKDISGIRIVAMHQVLPDDPAYPYSQPRVLVYKGEPTPAVEAFLAVATDTAGQEAVKAAEAAEAAALAQGENPVGSDALAQVSAGAAATTQAIGDVAGGAVDVASDAANVAGDAVNKAADATGDAVGNVAGAAVDATVAVGDAAGNVAGAATDAAGNAVAAAGDAAGNVAGNVADAAGDAAGAVGDVAGNVAGAAGDVAGNAVAAAGDVAGDAAGVVGDAAGNVVGAAGDAAGAVGDVAGNVAGAAGDAVANLPGTGVLKGRGLSPLWGVLPLAAIAAGGGLLWWLAAGKEDEDDLSVESRDSRELVGVGAKVRGKAGEVGTSAAALGTAGLGVGATALDKTQDGVTGAVDGLKDGVSNVGDGLKDGVSNVGDGLKDGVSNVGDGLKGGVDGLQAGVAGAGDTLKDGVAGIGEGLKGTASGAKNMGRNLSGKAAGVAGGVAAAAGGTVAAVGSTAGNATKRGGNFFSGWFGKAKAAAGDATDAASTGLKGVGQKAASTVGNVAGGVAGTVDGAADQLSTGTGKMAGNLKEGTVNAADALKEGAKDLKNTAGDAVEGTKKQVDDWRNDV